MLTLSLLLTLAAGPSTPPAPAPTAEKPNGEKTNAEKARESFTWAQKLYKQARYAEAAAKFEEAYVYRPHPVIQFNVGRCYEQLNDLPRAMRAYKDYLRLMPNATDKEAVTDAIVNIERRMQEKGVQQVLVFAEPANAVISVDDKTLGTSPASVELAPGNHQVKVSAPGHEDVQRAFVLSASRSVELSFTLKATGNAPVAVMTDKPVQPTFVPNEFPPPPPPMVTASPEPARKPRIATWVSGGVAVVAAGTSAGLYGAALGQASELKQMERPGEVQQQYVSRVESLQTGSTVAAGVAGAAAVTAIVLFFLEGR